MALTDPVIWQVGLLRIELPGHTIRLCDGGFINVPGDGVYRSEDPVFGTIESVTAVSYRVGDEAPSSTIVLQPPLISAASELFRPEAQYSPVHFWLAEFVPETGALAGDPELLDSGFVNTLSVRRKTRKVEMVVVSEAERLWWIKEGNVLTERWQKTVWPGESGLHSATGVPGVVAWGTAGPNRLPHRRRNSPPANVSGSPYEIIHG